MRYLALAALVAAVTLGGCSTYPSDHNGQSIYQGNGYTPENQRGRVDEDHGERNQ